MDEILEELHGDLESAAIAINSRDEDAWLAAMTNLRDTAWRGKALVLDKRWADRPRQPLATKPHRVQLDVSTLEDILNDTSTS